MRVQTSRRVLPAACWTILLCSCLSVALLHGAEAERKERLLHVPESVLLSGYPDDDALYVSRDGEELKLQPPGPTGPDITPTRACRAMARWWRPRM